MGHQLLGLFLGTGTLTVHLAFMRGGGGGGISEEPIGASQLLTYYVGIKYRVAKVELIAIDCTF